MHGYTLITIITVYVYCYMEELMSIKNVVFIEPKAENLHIYSRYNLPRIGSTLLATILRDKGFNTRVFFLTEKEMLKKQLK